MRRVYQDVKKERKELKLKPQGLAWHQKNRCLPIGMGVNRNRLDVGGIVYVLLLNLAQKGGHPWLKFFG